MHDFLSNLEQRTRNSLKPMNWYNPLPTPQSVNMNILLKSFGYIKMSYFEIKI